MADNKRLHVDDKEFAHDCPEEYRILSAEAISSRTFLL